METDRITFVNELDSVRIDKFLADELEDYSRSDIQNLIKSGNILVNEEEIKPSYKLISGDVITVCYPEQPEDVLIPQKGELEIIFENVNYAIINKPQNLVVHPGSGVKVNTLANILSAKYDKLSDCNGKMRPGIVHRLDKNTSGIMVIAKNNETHQMLAKQFHDRTVTREYIGIVKGLIKSKTIIDKPLARSSNNRTLRAIDDNGKDAVTIVEPIEFLDKFTLVKINILTGRTHQIRVHLSSIKHPIVGDEQYGDNNLRNYSQMLHSRCIEFYDDFEQKSVRFETSVPDRFIEFLNKCK